MKQDITVLEERLEAMKPKINFNTISRNVKRELAVKRLSLQRRKRHITNLYFAIASIMTVTLTFSFYGPVSKLGVISIPHVVSSFVMTSVFAFFYFRRNSH